MKKLHYLYFILLILCACSNEKQGIQDNSDKIVCIDGSSTVFPILKNAVDIYSLDSANRKVEFFTNFSGTTKGFEKLVRGEADIIGASRHINEKEDELFKSTNLDYIELMIGYDGIVVAVNAKNKWASSISTFELQKLWSPESEGKIVAWNQVNPNWPKLPLNLYGAGKNSGTFDYFTEAIMGKTRVSRNDFISSEDDNYLVHKISLDSLALGFFGYHYYIKNTNSIKALKVDNGNGLGFVAPSDSTIRNNTYKPLSRPLFIYVSKESLSKNSVKNFLSYFLSHLNGFVNTSEYISISNEELVKLKNKLKEVKAGSEFLK